jgi:hypothetical protein
VTVAHGAIRSLYQPAVPRKHDLRFAAFIVLPAGRVRPRVSARRRREHSWLGALLRSQGGSGVPLRLVFSERRHITPSLPHQ